MRNKSCCRNSASLSDHKPMYTRQAALFVYQTTVGLSEKCNRFLKTLKTNSFDASELYAGLMQPWDLIVHDILPITYRLYTFTTSAHCIAIIERSVHDIFLSYTSCPISEGTQWVVYLSHGLRHQLRIP